MIKKWAGWLAAVGSGEAAVGAAVGTAMGAAVGAAVGMACVTCARCYEWLCEPRQSTTQA